MRPTACARPRVLILGPLAGQEDFAPPEPLEPATVKLRFFPSLS
jgi:hypothetical protein